MNGFREISPPPAAEATGRNEDPSPVAGHDRVPAETKRDQTAKLPRINLGWMLDSISAEPPSLAAG
jgi:hypothetical protein